MITGIGIEAEDAAHKLYWLDDDGVMQELFRITGSDELVVTAAGHDALKRLLKSTYARAFADLLGESMKH